MLIQKRSGMSSQIQLIVDKILLFRKLREEFNATNDKDITKTGLQKKEAEERFEESIQAQFGFRNEFYYMHSVERNLIADKGTILDVYSSGNFPIIVEIGPNIKVKYEPRPYDENSDETSYVGDIGATIKPFGNMSKGTIFQFEGYLLSIKQPTRGEQNWIFEIVRFPRSYWFPAPVPPKEACFIATAAFGSIDDTEVVRLRSFRDRFLVKSLAGRLFISTYYQVSPPIAWVISRSQVLRKVTRAMLRFFVLPFTKISRD